MGKRRGEWLKGNQDMYRSRLENRGVGREVEVKRWCDEDEGIDGDLTFHDDNDQ
jgi:hypothetical protein